MELQEIYNVPLDHPDARKPASQFLRPLLNVAIAFIVIDTAFLIGRFVAVLFLRKKRLPLTWDDYLLVPAFFCTIGICINAFRESSCRPSALALEKLLKLTSSSKKS